MLMNIHVLRALFDSLCEQLENLEERDSLGFKTAYGIEFQEGVVMIFVFDTGALVFRFEVDKSDISFSPLQPMTVDDCLDMVDKVEHSQSISELFL